MKRNDNGKLTGAEERELVLQAGIQAIPHIGSSLSTLYFGKKQALRFKRLESFYTDLVRDISNISDQIVSMEKQNTEAFIAILENLHERVEAEHSKEKRQFLKNYFKNTLRYPVTTDFDKRKYFLDTIAEMTLLECEMLSFLCVQSGCIAVGKIKKSNTDQYAIVGAINCLKSYGFIMAFQGNFSIGSGREDNVLQEEVQVSTFGREFRNFCLEA